MKDQGPRVFFRELAERMMAMEATNGEGDALPLDQAARRAVEMLEEVRAASGRVMLVGNGGSSAIACHIYNDLCHLAGVRAVIFTDPSLLTALSNDHGYEEAFERGVELWASPGDLLMAISSSGQSENIHRAVRAAKARTASVITLSGFRADNPLRRMGEINYYVPSDAYGYVELAHGALLHHLTDCAARSFQEIMKSDA